MFKKIIIIFLVVLFTGVCTFAADTAKKAKSPYKTKVIEYQTKDNKIIKGTLMFPKSKEKGVKYPVIIFLHSLGYTSADWGTLPEEFVKQNYAVLLIDLRGHGQSAGDVKFKFHSWRYFTDKTFKKYPSDIIGIINQTKLVNKKVIFNPYAIIGGDIGANTAVLVAEKMYPKPKALVLLSPAVSYKGLSIASLDANSPITHTGNASILVISSKHNKTSILDENILKKFATGKFIIKNSELYKNGCLIIKYDPVSKKEVKDFINAELRPAKPNQSK